MVKKINEAEFNSEVKKDAVAVVDFNATWCGPCRMLAPVLEALSEEYAGQVNFYAVDVDENPGLATQYRIQSIPFIGLFKNGQFIDQSVGFRPQAQLSEWIRENL